MNAHFGIILKAQTEVPHLIITRVKIGIQIFHGEVYAGIGKGITLDAPARVELFCVPRYVRFYETQFFSLQLKL